MGTLSSLMSLVHVVGFALAAGSATVKLSLLLRCRNDIDFLPSYLRVVRPITWLIVTGMILLLLSGGTWLFLGHEFSPRLIVKLVLFVAVSIIGPVIDNVFEPRYRKLAPVSGAPISPEFLRAQRHYLTMEITATLLFYVIAAIWMLG